jgi:glycosyltransferase involved in cell wall biosynthesis
MKISVVLRSKDEPGRLRLTLASRARQTTAPKVVVVDDGSGDHTPEVIAHAARGDRGADYDGVRARRLRTGRPKALAPT